MGHERLGTLPKTQRWRDLVQQIASLQMPGVDVSEIAKQTTQNVRQRLRDIHYDEGVNAAFKFLIALAVASRTRDPQSDLASHGIRIPNDPTPLSLAKAVHAWVATKQESLEYGQIAQSAAVDAISNWYDENQTTQMRLFDSVEDPFEVWRKAATGAGFCELSRLFFANFTERYLNYFLEREASSVLPSIHDRDEFSRELQEHIGAISQHAFETARITQSFAAGWFNKNAVDGVPNETAIQGFLSIAFGKIRDELLREGSD